MTRLRSGGPGFDFSQGQCVSLRHSVQAGCEAHPASFKMDTGVLSHGIKWAVREADQSRQSSVEVKIAWRYTSTPPLSSWRSA